jgi:hypothetical protein
MIALLGEIHIGTVPCEDDGIEKAPEKFPHSVMISPNLEKLPDQVINS